MAANYFVSPTGSDTASGTSEASAWRNLNATVGRVKAGDTVTLLPGTWRSTLPLISGLAVKAKVPGTAIIDGSPSPVVSAWTKDSSGIWSTSWPGSPPMGLFLGTYEQNGPYTCAYDGRYAQFDPSRPSGKVVPGSKAQWMHANGAIQLTSISGGNPNADGLVIATGDGAITLDGLSDVHLDGIVTRYWRYSVGSNGGRNIAITNCSFTYAAQTSVWFTSIDGVELIGSRILGGGSLQAHAEDCLHCDGGKATISGTEIAWGGHGLAFCDRTGAFTFASNHLHDSGGSGITAARGVNDMRIEGNWIERCATQRSPSVRDVGAALQLHGDRHQIRNNHLEKNSKHVLMQSEGNANPSSSNCLFDRNTLLDAEETAIEYQEETADTGEKGRIDSNIWRASIISGAQKVDLLSLWFAGLGNPQSNQFQGCQINRGRIRGTLGTFSTVEEARAAQPAVYLGSQSGAISGTGSSLTQPPTPGDVPSPIPPPPSQKPLLAALTPDAGPPGVRVTATGSDFGADPLVTYSNADGGKRLENLGGTDTSVSWTMPADVVTGEVHVRRIDMTPTQLSNPLTFTVTGAPPPNRPPIAIAGGPYVGVVGVPVQFDGSGSSDPDGRIILYQWKIGSTAQAGAKIERTFTLPGEYHITLTVTDNQGATASAMTTATITAAPPAGELKIWLGAERSLNGAVFHGTVDAGAPLPAGSWIQVLVLAPDGRTANAKVTIGGDTPQPPLPGDPAAEVVTRTNQARATSRLTALTVNAKLTAAAQKHADWMARTNQFSHIGENGSQAWDRASAEGYSFSTIAENVAKSYTNVESVMLGWLNSAGHRANILNPTLQEIGVGIARGADGLLLWVQVFGDPAVHLMPLMGPG